MVSEEEKSGRRRRRGARWLAVADIGCSISLLCL